jgi:hypothetical protein
MGQHYDARPLLDYVVESGGDRDTCRSGGGERDSKHVYWREFCLGEALGV